MNDQPKLPYVVFSRMDSPSLLVRFSILGHGQKRICLKTNNEEDAIAYERKGRRVIRPAQHIEATLSTLRREAVTMRSAFKHAVRLGYIKSSDIPKIDLVAEERNKRPSFTDVEITKLMQVADGCGTSSACA